MTRRGLQILLVGGVLVSFAAPGAAQTFQPLFTKQYVRAAGAPVTVADTFAACDPTGAFRMVVTNGPGDQAEIGTDPISSGSIAVNGVEVIRESDLNANVTRIERPLTGLAASNRIDVQLRSGPAGAIRVAVEAAQACGLRITSPAPGNTVRAGITLVRGVVPSQPGAHVGVTVNGAPGIVEGTQFVAVVPLDQTVTAITAESATFDGVQARDTVTVAVVPGAEAAVRLLAGAPGGVAPLSVEFRLSAAVGIAQVALDADGDGVADFQGPALDSVPFTYARPGLYVPSVRLIDTRGAVHTAVTVVHVVDRTALDLRLQAVWTEFKNALRASDLVRAARMLHSSTRGRYQAQLARLSPAALANIDHEMTSIELKQVGFAGAEYEMLRVRDGRTLSFAVWFLLDQDGLWRLRRF